MQIPASGGVQDASQLTEPADDDHDHRWPQILPGGRVLYTKASSRDQHLQPWIRSLETGKESPLPVPGSFYARYLPGKGNDTTGFLLFMKAANLWAVRIDIESASIVGKRVPVVNGIHVSGGGNPHFAVAESGVLVYEPMRPPSPGRSLVWVNRDGTTEPLDTGKGFEFPRLSPDDRRVIFANHTDAGSHDMQPARRFQRRRARREATSCRPIRTRGAWPGSSRSSPSRR